MSEMFSAGIYYDYNDSRAQEDIFSTTEHNLGCTIGINCMKGLFSDIGYKHSDGTTHQMITDTTLIPVGRMISRQRYNMQTGKTIINSDQTMQTVHIRVGCEWTPKVLTTIDYIHRNADSDTGSWVSDAVSGGISYRF